MMDWSRLLVSTRVRKTAFPDDVREAFERDYDRSVFSSPVKRLQDKAQVFPLEAHDSVRTRLTHSLEVSAVARGLARAACRGILVGELQQGQDRQIEAIAATCGLLHDLGNPPFGHSGETAIRDWFNNMNRNDDFSVLLGHDADRIGDFQRFEGNAQTLRIVSKLQVLADHNGLNLTLGTLSALCKYTSSSATASPDGNHAASKAGFFTSERDLVAKIRMESGTGNHRNPITYLVEAADDIVYSVADIEDGIKKNLMSWEKLQMLLKQCDSPFVAKVLEGKDQILKPAEGRPLPCDVHAAAFRTASISVMRDAAVAAFTDNYPAIMQGEFQGELVKHGEAASYIKHLKDIGRSHIYSTPSNLKLELMGRKVIQDLMSLFWEGAKCLEPGDTIRPYTFAGKSQSLLSQSYRGVFDYSAKLDLENINYHRLQLVTDYVCGMTDSFAAKLHSELFNG